MPVMARATMIVKNGLFHSHFFLFLPMPLAVVWVFRLTFSPPPSFHFQLFVSVRYRKHCGRGGGWVLGSVCHFVYYVLFVLKE